jgi:hypothetical protein
MNLHHRAMPAAALTRVLAAALCAATLALGACTPGGDEGDAGLTPQQADEALAMRHEYEAALMKKDYDGAAKIANRLRRKYPDSDAMAKVRETLDNTIARAEAQAEDNRLAALWEYQKVAAGTGTQYTALIPSHVELDENGAPMGPPDARLVLRVHPEWGKSAYLLLSQKGFQCGDPCSMLITFDEAVPETYAGKQADSGEGPALFINEHGRFYAAMRSAKVIKIKLPSNGTFNSTLRFDVGGYDAARLRTEF